MKEKRLLSLLLASMMLISTACAGKTDSGKETTDTEALTSIVTDITTPDDSADTTSADLSKYSAWLGDRLSATVDGNTVSTDNGTVTLAIGEAMGVETTGLRDEGYIIKTVGTDTVIVAAKEAGLDAGVRKYAAVSEKTGSYAVNLTSGLKIGKVTLGGADISEYKILLPKAAEGDKSFQATPTMAMETAAKDLQKYIELATGHKLPIEYVVGLNKMTDAQVKENCGNGIVILADPTAKGGSSIKGQIEYVDGKAEEIGPGEMGTESYKLTVQGGLMRITGGNQRGCLYAVYDFLEQCIGWRFFGGDVEYLYEAEELNIDDIDMSHTPTFAYRATTMPSANDNNNFPKLKQNCFNTTRYAHSPEHGYGLGSTYLHAHTFATQLEKADHIEKGKLPYGDQPCLTDEETKEYIIDWTLGLINERLNPPFNTRIGFDTVQVGCSMNDNTNFCKCNNCMKVIRDTSFTDLYLGFVNDVAEAVDEAYPGMIVNTAIYFAARKLPEVTVPRDNVSIYYCIQGCNQHTICDGLCAGYETTLGTNNVEERSQLEGWTEICDRIYAWHYSTTFFSNLGPCPNVYEIYEDVTYVASLGIFGYYAEGSSTETNNFENLKAYLFCKLMYNADVTREEFMAMIDEYITCVYGEESAPYIRQYLDMHQQSGDAIEGCFINNYHYPLDMMDITYYRENYDTMKDLFDNAIRYAKDAETETKIVNLRLHMELIGLSATYERDYVNGTAESRAEYEASYKWLVDTYKAANLPGDRVGTAAPDNYDLSKNPMLTFVPTLPVLSKEGRA